MAERRMFAKTVIDSDAFLDMPASSRLLYFDLAIRADDDGFVNSPKKIVKMTGASMQDIQVLIANGYIILFEESGVLVIRHWLVHNYIRKDMYKPTPYKNEMKRLTKDENSVYVMCSDDYVTIPAQTCDEAVTEPSTQDRIGKDSTGKVSTEQERLEQNRIEKVRDTDSTKYHSRTHFVKPTVEQIRAYEKEMNLSNKAERFYQYYESCGWIIGRDKPMADWKAARMRWECNGVEKRDEAPVIQYRTVPDNDWEGFDDEDAKPISEEKIQAIRDQREGKITTEQMFARFAAIREKENTA